MANIQFQLRRGTSAEWALADPVLASGEAGYETDNNLLKIGDGITSWSLLPYLGSSELGGFPVSVSTLGDGDVLMFHQATSTWRNVNRSDIVDGGNF